MKQKVEAKINKLNDQIAAENDAVAQTHAVAAAVIKAVQGVFAKVQATQSIDDRIGTLIEGLQGVVTIVEDKHNNLEAKIDKLKLQVETLESLLEDAAKEERVGETSEDEDGEKKSEEE